MKGNSPADYTIAVVDDDPGTRDVFQRIFTHYHFKVETANDGESGLKLVLEQDIDLVILDVMMPGMDGYEVAAKLRDQKPLVPIVMLTARVDSRDRLRGLMTGAHRYLTKPCSPVKVLDEVAKLLGLPPVRPASTDGSDTEGTGAGRYGANVGPDGLDPETVEMPALRDEKRDPNKTRRQL
ncbi:MAG: response regulator transcription factor [Planctomycetota bacterium]